MTRTFALHELHLASVHAETDGKALVTVPERGVLVLTFHPLTRGAPIVPGDGGDLLATEDDGKPFDLSDIKE